VKAVTVAIAVGSNLGDRESHIEFAFCRLDALLTRTLRSGVRETVPVGVGPGHGSYLNAVVVGVAVLEPRALLHALLGIEADRGRDRPYDLAPRTLDLDLVLAGGFVIDEPGVQLPHPRFRDRLFVLEPLVEVAPDLHDPVTGKTMHELLVDLLARRRGGSD
jgi:2-amino-4-hydroxy-6-hydroxymethyldihydropteridine diphosphokinase